MLFALMQQMKNGVGDFRLVCANRIRISLLREHWEDKNHKNRSIHMCLILWQLENAPKP
jgi:hypothetical protein